MKKTVLSGLMLVMALGASPALAAPTTLTFDDPVVTSPTQAPGAWYTDRYAPANFEGGIMFDGDERGKITISPADSANNRPGPYSGGFYNTQGRTYDLPAGTTEMSIDYYLSAANLASSERVFGFWGTGVDGFNNIVSYPITELYNGAFRAYDSGTGLWNSFGGPALTANTWVNLNMKLVGANWVQSVGAQSLSVNALGAQSFSKVIIQGHNTQTGVSTENYFDNLTIGSAVPEPATWAMMIIGFGGVGSMVRANRRRQALVLA